MYCTRIVFGFVSLLTFGGIAAAQSAPPPPMPTLDFLNLKQEIIDPGLLSAPAPIMPAEATRSGYCCVAFDISASGRAVNIKADYCSEPLFETAAKNSVGLAEFSPAQIGGVRRISEGHSFDVTFKKEDVSGVIKPSADGKLTQSAIDNNRALCPA